MKMKWKLSALALGTVISFTAFNASAAEEKTAELRVIGTIAPASCEPTLSNGAVVDYGSISPASLTAVAPALNQLGTKKVSLQITCTSQTMVAIKASDNRRSSLVTLSENTFVEGAGAESATISTIDRAYGLGDANGVKIGAYVLAANVANIDVTDGADASFEVDMLTTRDTSLTGATWSKSKGGYLAPMNGAAGTTLTFAKTGTVTPAAIKTANVPLYITTAVQPMSAFTAGETITLDGLATISLVYL